MKVNTRELRSDFKLVVDNSNRASAGIEFAKYFLASFAALALDLALFSALVRLVEMPYAWAACVAFVAGAGLAYLFSVKWVFGQRKLALAPLRELVTFVAIGALGLALTQAILLVGIGLLAAMPELVKLVAAGITFIFNFVLRKRLLFVVPVFVDSIASERSRTHE